MKKGIKIVQFRDGMWGAKKRGWFGWKYWNYDPAAHVHYMIWTSNLPENDHKDRFSSKRLVVMTLSEYYHSNRRFMEI